jgi:methionyl-tRNA formyltransferase
MDYLQYAFSTKLTTSKGFCLSITSVASSENSSNAGQRRMLALPMSDKTTRPGTILFFGTPTFAAAPLAALLQLPHSNSERTSVEVVGVVTQPDRPAGRGKHLSASPVKQLAAQFQLPVFQPNSLRKELSSFQDFVSTLPPIDLGIVVAFGQILPAQVLGYPKFGCINIHASLLPRWRGAAPIQRAIISGDSETGICLMQMDEGLDTGSVLAQSRTPISEVDTFQTLHDRLSELGTALLVNHITSLLQGTGKSSVQPTEGVTYANKIAPSEAHISFGQPPEEVSCLIRGLSPIPGAYCFLGEQRLKIFMAAVSPRPRSDFAPASQATPGTLLRVEGNSVEVQCRGGSILIDDLQFEGKKRLSAAEVIRGHTLQVGAVLRGRA